MADEEKQQDYYDLMKQENYKTLLDREVQLNNARERALKQTNAGLGAIGMQSSGYGQTAKSGIESQYLSAMEGANQTYQEQNQDINLEQQQYLEQQQAASEQKQFYDMGLVGDKITQAKTQEEIDDIMNLYGLYTKDEQGNNVFDYEKAVELYGEQNATELQYLYNYHIKGIDDLNYQGSAVASNDYQAAISTFTDQNGKTGKVNDELKVLFEPSRFSKLGYTPANGDVLKVSGNSENGASTVYIIYRDGKWYQTSADKYANAKNKHWFRSSKNSNSKYYFDNTTINY